MAEDYKRGPYGFPVCPTCPGGVDSDSSMNLESGTGRMEEQYQQTIVICEDNFADSTDYLFKSMALSRKQPGAAKLSPDGLTLAELRTIMKAELDISMGPTPRRNFGNCKCTHPPSMGFCLLGACLGKGSGKSIKITINI
tara:strand:+ start:4299 stop:4718 length:420 start_codon:yes stop_codon:yes gene_type:complete